MITVPCNLCGPNTQVKTLWSVPDRHWAPEERFTFVQCMACRLVYLNPRPEPHELGRHYPSATYGQLPTGGSRAFEWRLARIERHARPGALLDVGCSNGGFLAFARQRGWGVHGFDTSEAGIRIAKELLGDCVSVATLKEAAYPSALFDVACLFEVLEHLPDPLEELAEIRRILKPGGWVCLSVPNFASWERMAFGPWWNGLDAPRHFYQFTPSTLRVVLERAGFAVVELRSVNACNIQAAKTRIDYCQESFRFFLRDFGLYPRRQASALPDGSPSGSGARTGWGKCAVHALEAALFEPFCFISRLADRDNTLWACARKAG